MKQLAPECVMNACTDLKLQERLTSADRHITDL